MAIKGKWVRGTLTHSNCTLSVPGQSRKFHGNYANGRVEFNNLPPIYVPQIPILNTLV